MDSAILERRRGAPRLPVAGVWLGVLLAAAPLAARQAHERSLAHR